MKRTIIPLLIFAALLSAASLSAAGIGIYGTGGIAAMSWYYSDDSVLHTTDYTYGGGLLFDTTVAANRLFGYRLTAGYEQYRTKGSRYDRLTDPIHRFSMTHTFGFGVLRKPLYRVWIGPQIGLHYLYKDGYADRPGIAGFVMYPLVNKYKVDIDSIGLDVLLALGINLNIGSLITLFIDAGFGYVGVYRINKKLKSGNAQYPNVYGIYDIDPPKYGHDIGMTARVGIIFRIHDTY